MTGFNTQFKLALLIAIISLPTALTATSHATCVAAPSGSTVTIDIQACIDGRDLLGIQGGIMEWEHVDFVPVGFHHDCPKNFKKRALIDTTLNGNTVLNSVTWKIKWPRGKHAKAGTISSVFTDLCPSLPVDSALDVTLTAVTARGSLAVIQKPDSSNNETTVLDFNDDLAAGPAIYEALVTFQVP